MSEKNTKEKFMELWDYLPNEVKKLLVVKFIKFDFTDIFESLSDKSKIILSDVYSAMKEVQHGESASSSEKLSDTHLIERFLSQYDPKNSFATIASIINEMIRVSFSRMLDYLQEMQGQDEKIDSRLAILNIAESLQMVVAAIMKQILDPSSEFNMNIH